MNNTKKIKANLQPVTLAPVLYAVTFEKFDHTPVCTDRPSKFATCFGFYTSMTDAQNAVDEMLQDQAKLGNIVIFRDPIATTIVRSHDDPAVMLVIDIITYSSVRTTDPRYNAHIYANPIYNNNSNNNDVLVFAVISEYAYDTKAYRTNLSMSYK